MATMLEKFGNLKALFGARLHNISSAKTADLTEQSDDKKIWVII